MDWLAFLSTSFLINVLVFAVIFVILFTIAVSTAGKIPKKELETGKFDLALVDLGLENSDISKGLELFHQLHTKKHGNLQTFILSGHSTEETQGKFKEVFKPEIEAGTSWGTLWRDIHSRYFSKNNVQDLMHLVKEIQRIH